MGRKRTTCFFSAQRRKPDIQLGPAGPDSDAAGTAAQGLSAAGEHRYGFVDLLALVGLEGGEGGRVKAKSLRR